MCTRAQVVDAGFSFTHALPLFDGQVLLDGVRRINLGGKALTNYFKELVSYRWACVYLPAPLANRTHGLFGRL
jgi:actin-related protein